MAICYPPYIKQDEEETTETQALRERGGWRLVPEPRVGLDQGSDDELLLVNNSTDVRWIIYHNYHRLGIIDENELLVFHIHKHGKLSVRPDAHENEVVEYLTLSLFYEVNAVEIYRRHMREDVTVFDLRAT